MKTWILNNLHNLLIATLAVISPVKELLLTVGFLIMMDFMFGIYRAYRKDEVINSRKMGNTISKMFLYNMMVLSVYLLDHYILKTGLNLEKIAAGLIGVVEIKSLDENFKILFGWSIWEKLKNSIQRGSSTTKDIIDDIEKPTNK